MDLYAIQRLVGTIEDVPALRDAFIEIFDSKTKYEMARFGLQLADHLAEISGFPVNGEITEAFAAVQEWLDGRVNYQKARTLAGAINDLARQEADPVKAKFDRTMAQIACIPHVKFHALWACDFAVALINRLAPGDLEAVRKERQTHIELLQGRKQPCLA
ncbi:hypothetical protein LJC74_01355 [Eubacteriales bacterium OttesenSCG-928-A19]|nr:hypothetical protein [Eubacteriales bacterium OttesenSCG-928-A19]